MKNLWKVLAVALVIGLVCFGILQSRGGDAPETKREPLPLFVAADSADFMIAYAVGLGEVKRKRTIDGRLYRNFVQLLRTNRMQEDLQDTLATSCKTGLRLALYKDTSLIEEFRFADRIGRDSVPGVWTPRRLGKINKFLKDNGVQFVACNDSANVSDDLNVSTKTDRPILTMPEIGAARKRKKNMAGSSVAENVPSEISNGEITNNVINALDGLILPADTAVGEPLYKISQNWNRGEVTFYENEKDQNSAKRTVVLTEEQLKTFNGLLKNGRYETYASSMGVLSLFSKVTLFKDSVAVMELQNSRKYEWLTKFPMTNGTSLGAKGVWFASDPNALQTFFDSLK